MHDDLELTNITSLLVNQRLDEIFPKADCCKCDQCRNDVAALALNDLRPAYVHTTKGGVFKKLEAYGTQNAVDIDIAIRKAIKTVRENPRHE